jgi:hypothetical protein
MLLVLTGAACSGRSTLLSHILKSEGVQEIRLLSTCPRDGYDYVSDELFDAVPDMVILHSGSYRTGVSRATLTTRDIGIIRCNYDEAKSLSLLAPSLNTSSICVFLHCRATELLCRLHERLKIGTGDCEELIKEIYRDHNMAFVELENSALAQQGFNAVLPVNTSIPSEESYNDLILKPLLSMFDSLNVYKNMCALRKSPMRLKHAI